MVIMLLVQILPLSQLLPKSFTGPLYGRNWCPWGGHCTFNLFFLCFGISTPAPPLKKCLPCFVVKLNTKIQ